jgi:hypothetical protein
MHAKELLGILAASSIMLAGGSAVIYAIARDRRAALLSLIAGATAIGATLIAVYI